jgi:hypothetical protein
MLQQSDFTATDGSTVVLASACSLLDDVRIIALGTFQVANATPADGSVTTAKLAAAAVTQAKLGANVAGNGPAFYACNSGAMQSVSNGTDTTLAFQSEVFDVGNCYNNTASPVTQNGVSVPGYGFAPNIAGYYQINANQTFSPNATGVRFIKLLKNSNIVAASSSNGSGADWSSQAVSALVYLNGTGDYVIIQAWQDSGVSLSFASTSWNSFSASLVRAA